MLYADMLALTRPFKGPFRIVTTNGETYDVRHREGFLLTISHIVVGLLKDPDGDTYERSTYIDLAHIVRVEPLTVPTPPKQGNGQAS
jgi:hypothetical protein